MKCYMFNFHLYHILNSLDVFAHYYVQANAGMTALFVRSLQRLPSLQATVISNAANMAATVSHMHRNYVCLLLMIWSCLIVGLQQSMCDAGSSECRTTRHLPCLRLPPAWCCFAMQGLLGHLLFAELITLRWTLGIALVIQGLVLISSSVITAAPAQQPSSSSKQDKAAAKKHT